LKTVNAICFIVITATFASLSSHAQTRDARPFKLWLDCGAGYSRNISPGVAATAIPGGDHTNGGFTGLIRMRGSRNNFITIGLETGWLHLSSVSQQNAQTNGYGTTNINATLSAIPVMGVVTLQDYDVQLHGSVGLYRLISTASLFGNTVTSSEWDMAFTLAAGYEIMLPDEFELVPEFRWTRINDQQKSFLSILLRVQFPPWIPF
jgi:hypothetical protein